MVVVVVVVVVSQLFLDNCFAWNVMVVDSYFGCLD